MILLGLVAIALAIVYAGHLVRDELRVLLPFVRRLVHVVDAEHLARIERDAITTATATTATTPNQRPSGATTSTTSATTTATASSESPRKRRKTQPSVESPTSSTGAATMPPSAPSAPSLHIPTQPFGTPLSPRSD